MNTTKQKWFYPAQEKIKTFLNEKFDKETISCNFQDVCKTTVHENWVGKINGEATYVHFIIYKAINSSRSIIHTYWLKYEDTMQYFKF